jgi:hypothetical protein
VTAVVVAFLELTIGRDPGGLDRLRAAATAPGLSLTER